MPLSMCSRCHIMISISNAPGGNPIARMSPDMMTTEYGQCDRCRAPFCARCIRSAGGKCPDCGQATQIQGPPPGPARELPEAQRRAIEQLLAMTKAPAAGPAAAPAPQAAGPSPAQGLQQLAARGKSLLQAMQVEGEVKQTCLLLRRRAYMLAGPTPAGDLAAETTAVAQAISRLAPGTAAATVQAWAQAAVGMDFVGDTLKAIAAARPKHPAFGEARDTLVQIAAGFQLWASGGPGLTEEGSRSAQQGAQALAAIAEKLKQPPPAPTPPAPTPEPAPAPAAEMMHFRCPNPSCNSRLKANRAVVGKKVRCQKCGTSFVLAPA